MKKSRKPVSPGRKKPASGRVYTEYDREYQARPEQVAKRVERNRARRKALKEGRVSKGDGKDVHHPDGAAKGGKTRVTSAKRNRSMK